MQQSALLQHKHKQGGMLSMHVGRIKCFFQNRGYGYIEDGEGREVYFSLSAIDPGSDRFLSNGSQVYYHAITTGLGLEALRVQPIER